MARNSNDGWEQSVADMPERYEPRRSYSIEAEDLLAETVWCLVLKRPFYGPGFFVDIGAAHPIQHSNTFHFYEAGWTGVCVEPNPEFHALYARHRPRDRALNMGIAASSATLAYHRFSEPLINGFFGADLRDRHMAGGNKYLGETKVSCLGVKDFLREHVAGGPEVDFLNIDVETLDAEILGAWDWRLCRPKMICAEIHTTSIRQMLDTEIASILESVGYVPVSRGWLSAIFADGRLVSGR